MTFKHFCKILLKHVGLTLACMAGFTFASAGTIEGSNLDDLSQNQLRWVETTVKSGDTLSGIVNRLGIAPSELHAIISTDSETKRLTWIMPGDGISFGFDKNDKLQVISKPIDQENTLIVKRAEQGFISHIENTPLERRLHYATGTINSSLFEAAQNANISQPVILEMAGLFGWDIDFSLDVRNGDQFSVIYETFYRDGNYTSDGKIIAAEYINDGRSFKAVRYTDPKGYTDHYSSEGQSLRKAFLRSPIEFARITSGFNLRRRHPILHTIRAHKGVDYAAKPGTPIRSTGDGKVVFRGRKGGYGHTVVIQHGSKYSTLYAHMSKYASKAKLGRHVKQGQIIGYVGSSGLATGPHLHYEFRANGVHRNPLRFNFPGVAPVAEEFKADFTDKTQPLVKQLSLLSGIKLQTLSSTKLVSSE